MTATPPDQAGLDYLEVQGLTVEFDGFKAIDGVDLTLLQGRLHFLIGPNGAGKTTLVDALTGLVPASGIARYRNKNLLAMKSHQIVRAGIGRTFQTATVFEKLSVLQNLDIAGGVHRKAWRMAFARGKTPGEIARELCLSAKTISSYRAKVLEKLQARSNSDLTYYALKHELLE